MGTIGNDNINLGGIFANAMPQLDIFAKALQDSMPRLDLAPIGQEIFAPFTEGVGQALLAGLPMGSYSVLTGSSVLAGSPVSGISVALGSLAPKLASVDVFSSQIEAAVDGLAQKMEAAFRVATNPLSGLAEVDWDDTGICEDDTETDGGTQVGPAFAGSLAVVVLMCILHAVVMASSTAASDLDGEARLSLDLIGAADLQSPAFHGTFMLLVVWLAIRKKR